MKPYSSRLRTAKKRLWKKISELVRRKYADENGMVRCYTCSCVKHWKDGIQAGHYIAQGNCAELEFTLDNLRPQCAGCNLFKSGNTVVFRWNLCQELGETRVKEMEKVRMSLSSKKWNLSEIESLEEEIDLELAKL